MENEQSFEYTYSAPEQSEIKSIREKYLSREVSKMEQLRMLDESATKRGSAVSIGLGTISALILGLGMSCCMVWSGVWFIPGILIGCIGIVGVLTTYPVYNRIVAKDREKIAPEILRLSEELLLGN